MDLYRLKKPITGTLTKLTADFLVIPGHGVSACLMSANTPTTQSGQQKGRIPKKKRKKSAPNIMSKKFLQGCEVWLTIVKQLSFR